MKEVVITGPRQFEVRQAPVPKPGDGEVLIQMKAAGVCGSDFHLFLGENPNAVYPRIPGHENAGVVVEVGKDVTSVQPGDAVVVDLVVACGHCPQCLSGRRNICRTVKARGAAIAARMGFELLQVGAARCGAALPDAFGNGVDCFVR